MTTPIKKLQEEFNAAISEHEEINNSRHACHERGDVDAEQRHLDAMKRCGERAVDAQKQSEEILSKKPGAPS